jgi:hypothetical protein
MHHLVDQTSRSGALFRATLRVAAQVQEVIEHRGLGTITLINTALHRKPSTPPRASDKLDE